MLAVRKELVANCVRSADISVLDVDAVECLGRQKMAERLRVFFLMILFFGIKIMELTKTAWIDFCKEPRSRSLGFAQVPCSWQCPERCRGGSAGQLGKWVSAKAWMEVDTVFFRGN